MRLQRTQQIDRPRIVVSRVPLRQDEQFDGIFLFPFHWKDRDLRCQFCFHAGQAAVQVALRRAPHYFGSVRGKVDRLFKNNSSLTSVLCPKSQR